MSDHRAALALAVPDELVEAIAHRVPELMPDSPAPTEPSPWLDVDQAARYLACEPPRVYNLVSQGRLRCAKDGRRSLFRREWLDAYLKDGAA